VSKQTHPVDGDRDVNIRERTRASHQSTVKKLRILIANLELELHLLLNRYLSADTVRARPCDPPIRAPDGHDPVHILDAIPREPSSIQDRMGCNWKCRLARDESGSGGRSGRGAEPPSGSTRSASPRPHARRCPGCGHVRSRPPGRPPPGGASAGRDGWRGTP